MGMRINLGSGQRPFGEGWTNIDCQARWAPDIVCDASKGLPHEDETVDMVVLHHVLEHFGCGEADRLISECHRVLRPGGSLLVFVPDLRALARRWMAGQLDTQLYLTQLYGAYMGDEADRHKWGFDPAHLRALLGRWGWSAVIPYDWRVVEGADIAKDWYILGMECVR